MGSRIIYACLCVFVVAIQLSRAFPGGANEQACNPALTPNHNVTPSSGYGGFSLKIYTDGSDEQATGYVPGESVMVEIVGTQKYKGFLIAPKSATTGSIAKGEWQIPLQRGTPYQGMKCINDKDTLTHVNAMLKPSGLFKARWTADKNLTGRVRFQASVVISKQVFYMLIHSKSLSQDEATTTTSTITTTTTAPPNGGDITRNVINLALVICMCLMAAILS